MSEFNDSDDFDCQDIDVEIQQPSSELVSVKQFLSQPNQLLDKILFCEYQANSLFPTPFTNLPAFVKHDKAQIDQNNMNSIYQSKFQHEKLKNNVLNFLLAVHGNKQQPEKIVPKKKLPTMLEHYETKQPIYQKYPRQSPYPATYILDPKTINSQKTIKKPLTAQNAAGHSQGHSRKRSGSVLNSSRSRIQFESSFCSGNLFEVYQIAHNQFDLVLQNDINTKGNNQWFFFRVRNVPKNMTVKFNIVNLTKKYSLFEDGMKPCIFSESRYEKRNVGWVREGMKVNYTENQKFSRDGNSKKSYYQLSFEYKFIYQGDIVYFSHAVPYTLSDLTEFVGGHLKQRKNNKLIRFKNLGRTLGNQEIDVLQITNEEYRAVKKKKSVWIIARQHPGEVTSSFMIEGIINRLLDRSDSSNALLKNYVFKIVPMLNMDGVVHGNSRAQFSGADPNRRWINPHKIRNPIIYTLKKAIEKDKNTNGIQMFLDLHSHSKKMGTFFYGNSFLTNKMATRKYPMMVCKKDNRFCYENSRFSSCNPSSARQVLFDTLQIPLVYTVESSFYGYKKNQIQIVEYLPKDYKEMGTVLIETLWDYAVQKYKNFSIDETFAETNVELDEADSELERIRQKDQELDDNGISDSDASEDELDEKALKNIMPKLFLKKKKKEKKKANKQKIKEEPKKEEVQVPPKIKKNDKESHYRIYFSGRTSALDQRKSRRNQFKVTKQCVDFGVQISIPQPSILKTCSNTKSVHKIDKVIDKKNERRNGLCIMGQKVEEDILVLGNNIGIQTELNKIFTKNKEELRQSIPRRSFKVTTNRGNSLVQTKQNNFLNKGDCFNWGTTWNFQSRR